jgi:site-specific DNA recombinase
MRAAIYVRVSSARQVEDGLSLDVQERQCRDFAERQGWELREGDVYVEAGVSGGRASRPALDALMAAVDAGEVQAVVTPRVDRLGRNARHNLELFERFDAAKVVIHSPDGRTHADKFVRTIESAVAERERELISERVTAITPAKRARGSYNGGPRPYGYDFAEDGGLVINSTEANILRRLFREYLAGKSLRGIARDLNLESVRGPLGGTWSQGRVADRLDMPLYAGFVGGGAEGRHEPLIDLDTWRRTRELRDAGSHELDTLNRRKAGRRPNTHLLAGGHLRCRCGASMYPRKDTRSGRDTYRCRGRDERTTTCDMPPLPASEVDAAVREYIASVVFSPGLATGELAGEAKRAAKAARRVAAEAEREVRKQEDRLKRLRIEFLDGVFTRAEYEDTRADLEAAMASAREWAAESRRVAEELGDPSPGLLEAVEGLRSAALGVPSTPEALATQRAVLARLFERFEVATGPAEMEPDTGVPHFEFKPARRDALRVVIFPEPHPHVLELFPGAADPLDGLTQLQSVREGLPWR